MGKKYIIELESGTHIFVLGPEGIVHIGEPDVVYETVDGMQIGDAVINAKPYTEPDLEQVRKEAYEEGRNSLLIEVQKAGKNTIKLEEDEYYQRGLNDAWDAARKIGNMPYGEEEKAFGSGGWAFVEKHTASEAIEKIRQYEQEKRFCVGDEFVNESGKRFVIIKMDGTEIDRYIDEEGKTYCMITKYKVIRKTGRHFPEIAAVLEKMRGERHG